ncbi:MAG: Flp pilus assembly protein CpaB [Actinomycetota bacterium]|nr:Flp pilus assembly protein CpaB [Actinomycetota bacterium]
MRNSKIYLLLSIIAAALAAAMLFACLNNLRSRIAESGNLVRIVVAARDLEAGEVLDPSCLEQVNFPDRYLLPGTFTDIVEVNGEALRHSLHAGEPLLVSALLTSGTGGSTQDRLEEGFCAFPLPASAISFPAAELWQGSCVDILALADGQGRTILENIEVLGVSGTGASYMQTEGDTFSSAPYVGEECVLLQLTAEEACLLAAAMEEGKVELMLRPPR